MLGKPLLANTFSILFPNSYSIVWYYFALIKGLYIYS